MGFIPRWLIWILVVIIVIIVLSIVVSALGGFDWVVHIGHLHWDIGVSKGA